MLMASKTDTEVIIGGKVFTLSGYESEEYLQKVASYINNKIADYSKMDGFKRQPVDTQNVLLQLNIADDYFKAKKQVEMLEGQLSDKEKELYDIKHELIATQIKLENTEKNVKNLQSDITEDSRKIIQMETELKTLKK
jgi:cell division protein ZapA